MPQAWLEDTRKAWEREANGALERAGCGERIDHRSLAERRDEAERAGDLERAAELSRKPNVHLGPQALRELPGEPESFVHQKAERVEKDNESLVEERDGLIERIKERIAGIYQELQALPEKIRGAGGADPRRGRRSGSESGSMGEGSRRPGPSGSPNSPRNTLTLAGRKSATRPRAHLSPHADTSATWGRAG